MTGAPPDPRRQPAGIAPGAARLLVLLATFVCAACGLVYELELVALGGRLLGDPVTQTSVVLSVMVFAMGMGSLLAKHLTHRPATAFAVVEAVLALVGGLSGLGLYACWVWLGHCRAVTVALAALIGMLIGAEIPLLMTLIQRIRRQDAGRAVADLFAADYVGALVGGLAFPFLLLPAFGQAAGALVAGAVNAVAGGVVVLWLFRDEPAPRTRLLLWAGCGLVLAALGAAAAGTSSVERAARHALYGDRVRFAEQSPHQEIVLTGAPTGAGLRLYLDGRLAVCGADQQPIRRALVQPAMAGRHSRVLVLGGGDGLTARQVLDHPGVRRVLAVDPDPALVRLARHDPAFVALNRRSLDDPRVRVETADPLAWLRGAAAGRPFDVILADRPETAGERGAELWTEEFYGLAARLLAPGGRLAVYAGPLDEAGWQRFWGVEATLRSAALHTVPFAVPAGSARCGDPVEQGFLLAAPARGSALPRPPATGRDLHRGHRAPEAATLLHPLE
ncbi:polyamine aminopropyltransferase [Peterkaempfera griseoplana]|uniref:polyamine aminopropyltransferase n=1 Tax=Peterkaempfera griseoplana TaxID=66896 RepID=UPI0006E325C8|nr:polyamine aminopropyltransferase [Peterkaempfera griseoplana]